MSAVKKWTMISLCALVLIFIIAFWWYKEEEFVYTNDAAIDGYFVLVSPDILARVVSLEVDEGDFVEQGQLLVTLDDTLIVPQKLVAAAEIETNQATLAIKEVELKKIKDDYERGVKGIKGEVITSQQFDHLSKAFDAANAEIELAQSNIKLAKAKLEQAEALLKHTKIYADRRGVISKRWGLTGNVLQPGQTIFSLYDLDNIWVLANLQETDIAGVHIGSHVEISVDAYPGVKFTGEVFVIKAAAASQFSFIPQDNATGNYTKVAQRVPLKISIRPPKDDKNVYYLFNGMSCEVKIML